MTFAKRNTFAALLPIGLLMMPTLAHAQSVDGQIDVVAVISENVPPLTITGTNPLDFGTVAVGLSNADACSYEIDSVTGAVSITIGGTPISERFCQNTPAADGRAGFEVGCVADAPIAFAFLGLNQTFYQTENRYIVYINGVDRTGGYWSRSDTAVDSNGITYVSGNASITCPSSGTETFRIGGQITLPKDAVKGADQQTIGTLIMRAAYSG